MIIISHGKLIRIGVKAIKVQGRNTQSGKVIDVGEGDHVVAVGRLHEVST